MRTCIRPGCVAERDGALWCRRHKRKAKQRQQTIGQAAGTCTAVAGGPRGVGTIDDNNWRAWPAYGWSRKRETTYRRAIREI